MAKLSKTFQPAMIPIILHRKSNELMANNMPRLCMLISTSLSLAAISIPVFMVLHLLPVTLVLTFVGYGLALCGGVMSLIFFGEI